MNHRKGGHHIMDVGTLRVIQGKTLLITSLSTISTIQNFKSECIILLD